MRCTSRSFEHAMWKRLSKYALKQRVVHSSTPKCKHGNGVMTVIAQVLRSESNTLQRRVPCFFMNKYERASLLLMTTFWDIELPTQRNSLPELFNRIFMLLKFCQEHTHAHTHWHVYTYLWGHKTWRCLVPTLPFMNGLHYRGPWTGIGPHRDRPACTYTP